MPQEHLKVQEGVIGGLASRLTAAGQRVTEARSTLVDGMYSNGRCWGRDDEVARAFVSEYEPGSQKVLDGTQNLADFLTGMGHQLRSIGRSLLTAESDNS